MPRRVSKISRHAEVDFEAPATGRKVRTADGLSSNLNDRFSAMVKKRDELMTPNAARSRTIKVDSAVDLINQPHSKAII